LSAGTITLTSPETEYFIDIVGYGGTGVFNQNGGTQTINQILGIGYLQGSEGFFNLTAGTLNVVGGETIAVYGSGTFTQTGGTNSFTGGDSNFLAASEIFIGYGVGSSGTYLMHGGAITTGNTDFAIRTDFGNGTFTMDGGYISFPGGNIRAGLNSGSVANYTITGGIITNAGTGSIFVGESGSGALNVGGNAVVSIMPNGNDLYFGLNSGGVGAVHVYGNATLSVWDIRTDSGQGTFVQDGGTVNGEGWMQLGINAGSISSYTLNSGNLNLTGQWNVHAAFSSSRISA